MSNRCSVLLAVLMAGCPTEKAAAPKPVTVSKCLADQLGPLNAETKTLERCDRDAVGCRDECVAGNASACINRAMAIERDAEGAGEAAMLYARACQLGAETGCTNYAAAIWADERSTDEATACAAKLFDKACAADDPFACGMKGRMLLESDDPSRAGEARKVLETSCERLKGFPCRVLALHLERGTLGQSSPARVKQLLVRACEGGDPDACGDPRTAEGTFRGPDAGL